MRSDNRRRVRRIAIAIVLLFFVVNLITGPGVPQIIGGTPVLYAHDFPRSVNWPIWWLNLALMIAGFLALGGAVTIRQTKVRGSLRVISERILLQERLLDGTLNGEHYSKRVNVRLTNESLDVRPSPFFLPDRPGVIAPLSNIAAVRFSRTHGIWSVTCETWGHRPQTFGFTPRTPRRWYVSFRAAGVEVRPDTIVAKRLPQLQPIVVVTLLAPFLPFAAGFALLLYSLLRSVYH